MGAVPRATEYPLDKSGSPGVCTHMEMSVRRALTPQTSIEFAPLIETTSVDFNDFYRRELPKMIALAQSICGDRALAEDLAQEAMTRAHTQWRKIEDYERPGAWLRRVTINLALSRRRRIIRELALLTRIASEPEAICTNTDTDSAVWDAVRQLPPKQRAAIALFYQEDQSTSSIAEILGCSISTATSHLNLARKRLAQLLAEAAPEELL